MLDNWQFNVLFFVGVGGALIMLFGSDIGLSVNENPMAITGVGAILTFILAQKPKKSSKKDDEDDMG